MKRGASTPGTASVTPRRAARLAAVQALYEMDMAGAPADSVLREFMADRWLGAADEGPAGRPDAVLFASIVRGVGERQAEIDDLLKGALAAPWPLQRLEVVLRAILRAGVFELLACADIPAKVAITEYVGVAQTFFDGGEPALVNGVLDRLAHLLRGAEFAAPTSGSSADDR